MTAAPLNTLIIGQHGQVARELQLQLAPLGTLHVLGRDALDLAHPGRSVSRCAPWHRT